MATVKSETAKNEEPKMIKIRVPKIEGVKGDLTVGWNGKMYKVKRGMTVEVPEVVAKIIEFSESVEAFANSYEDSVAHE